VSVTLKGVLLPTSVTIFQAQGADRPYTQPTYDRSLPITVYAFIGRVTYSPNIYALPCLSLVCQYPAAPKTFTLCCCPSPRPTTRLDFPIRYLIVKEKAPTLYVDARIFLFC
jgi:hypothetical protein